MEILFVVGGAVFIFMIVHLLVMCVASEIFDKLEYTDEELDEMFKNQDKLDD